MVADEYSLLQCLDLELPVEIENSIAQDFLFHEKRNNLPCSSECYL